ncbi:unnamed protein product [Periconia digitata]|uniref:Uncharacterized protein n=1 Tax=Periconia digitata TaxID=1303443 RepID=A0A9W4XPM9_9PLEO|nr:unnamed protein product [Periconia digitata]
MDQDTQDRDVVGQNYSAFRDCLGDPVIRALAVPPSDSSFSGIETSRKKRREMRKDKKKKKKKENNKSEVIGGKKEGSKGEGGNGHGDGDGDEEEDIMVDTGVAEPLSRASETRGGGDEEHGEMGGGGGDELGDFIEYLTSLIFPSLPPALRTLTHSTFQTSQKLQATYTTPLPPSTITALLTPFPPTAIDALESASLLPHSSDATDHVNFFAPVLNSYVGAVTAPPPLWSTTRTAECELCAREWIPLTYHHLIPRSTHEKVLKRRWHREDVLDSVAWLCRACHSFVHRLASNEGLARGFYTMDLVREGGVEGEKREQVEGWVKWVGGVRWKSR